MNFETLSTKEVVELLLDALSPMPHLGEEQASDDEAIEQVIAAHTQLLRRSEHDTVMIEVKGEGTFVFDHGKFYVLPESAAA